MFKRKLFKRALPVILSVAMVFESMPATALAAESTEITEVVETTADGSGSETDSAGNEDQQQPPQENENSPETPASMESSAPTESSTAEESTILTESTASAENSAAEESTALAESTASAANEEDETEKETEELQGADAPTELPEAEIVVEPAASFGSFTKKAGDAVDSYIYEREYAEDGLFDGVIEDVSDALTIKADNADESALGELKNLIEYTYETSQDQQAWTPVDGVPADAGSYSLKIYLKENNICKEKTVYISFDVKQKALKPDFEDIETPAAGDSIKDYGKAVEKANEKVQWTFSAKVHELDSEGKLSAEETADKTFDSSKNYAVVVTAAVNEAYSKNYTVDAAAYYPVAVGTKLVDTAVSIDRKEDNKAEVIVRTYDGTELLKKADIISTYVNETTLKVTKGTGDDAEAILEGEAAAKEVVSAWYTREKILSGVDETKPDKDQWDGDENGTTTGEATYRYTLVPNDDLSAARDDLTEAGAYYLVYTYPGEEGRYRASDRVVLQAVIEPATLILEPADFALTTGMNRDAVDKALALAEYTLVDEKGGKYPAGTDPLPEDFFGSAFGNGMTTQYFAPVFRLDVRVKWDAEYISGLKADHKPDEEYTSWVDWSGLSGNEWKKLTGLEGSKAVQIKTADGRDIEYRIIFTGEKAVYDVDGDKYVYKDPVSITDTTTLSADKNHKVKADTETLEAKAKIVSVSEAEKVEINVGGILENYKDKGTGKIDAPAWKIYDGAPLFAARADYKKATVTGVETSTDESITYTWKRVNNFSDYVAYLEADNEKAENGKTNKENAEKALLDERAWSNWIGEKVENSEYLAPTDAGLYRLKIDYKDKDNKRQPATEYVYFEIKKQAIITEAGNQYAEYNNSISNAKGTYSIYKIGNNDLDAFMKTYKAGTAEPLDWNCNDPKWKTEIADGESWSEVSAGSFLEGEKYRRYAYFDSGIGSGQITDSEGNPVRNENGNPLIWSNYTNLQTYETSTQGRKYYNIPAEIQFGKAEIEVEVDGSFLKDVVYNAEPATKDIAITDVIKLKDKATGAALEGLTVGMATEQGDSNTVNVYWRRNYTDKYGWSGSEFVPFNEAVYGGTYTLVASFSGNDTYKLIDMQLQNEEGSPYQFTIAPLEIGIAPMFREEAPAAGELVSELLDREQIAVMGTIPEADKKLFEYNPWNSRDNVEGTPTGWYEGYGIFMDGGINEDSGLFSNAAYYKDGKATSDKYLRFGSEYFAKFNAANQLLYGDYEYSYKIIDNPSKVSKVGVRGESDVISAPAFTNNDGWVDVIKTVAKEDGKNTKYTIIPREAIPFAYNNGYSVWAPDGETTAFEKDRNYLAFRIMVPREFYGELDEAQKNFIYKNSIIAAGGYSGDPVRDGDDYYIKVLFPIETEEIVEGKITKVVPKEIAPFNITWEKDYTETLALDLTNAVLESDLKKAVAPKSLAFNGVQAKMAVGESQQLDLKITKANLGDVIKIHYRAVGNDAGAISIDPETGIVTALKSDKKAVNIEAYPVRLSDDGKTYEEITGKGVKIAKTKVTVTEVTAPAVKKIVSVDSTTVDVQYSPVKDGYRREIYVKEIPSDATGKVDKTELKKWTDKKNNEFEKTISEKMTNGQWEAAGFAREPVYLSKSAEKEYYDAKLKLNVYELSLPKANTTYVVYVRNVSAARTLADGSKVTLSAAGTMKNFVTVKSQVEDLIPWFEVANDDENDAENYNTPTVKNPVVYWTDQYRRLWDGMLADDLDAKRRSKRNRIWTVDYVSAKSLQLMVDGEFYENPSNPAAEGSDTIYRTLPIKKDKEMLADYVDPKLTYAVFDSEQDINEWDSNAKLINGKWVIKNQSKYAAVNNGGKLTLKGVGADGEAVLYIYALADNGTYGCAELHVTARPTEVKGKKAKLKVGDQVRLATLLEYKEGKKKVPNYISTNITITDTDKKEAEKAGFRLEQIWDEDGRKLSNGETCAQGEWLITVVKDGKFDLTITDKVFETSDAMTPEKEESASVSLNAAALDPVKGLKVAYVDDSRITVNFAHAGNPEAFNIEVTDAAGRVVFKRLVWNNMETTEYVDGDEELNETTVWSSEDHGYGYEKLFVKANAKAYWQELQRSAIRNNQDDSCLAYFEKTKNYAYTITSEKLLRLSSYNITVTPVFENEAAAKPAKTKAKTTNVPASYKNLNIVAPEVYDGEDIYYYDGNISQYPYFVSGNTYTLVFGGDDFARDRITDTLTWKSSNTKVASVKANAGSFTAALKAQQQGTTVITVTSKITKKIVARYLIAVRSVGNGKGYLGDYERGHQDFYDDVVFGYDPGYQGRLEVLTLSNPVVVDENYLYGAAGVDSMDDTEDATWVQFTAPAYGAYTFSCEGGNSHKVYRTRKLEPDRGDGSSLGYRYTLEAGEKIYFRICGTFTLSVGSYTDFATLTIANDSPENALEVARASYIAFTAPEDNSYTFKTVTDNKEENPSVATVKKVFLEKGKRELIEITRKCYLYVEPMAKDAVELTVNEGNGVLVEFTKPEKDTKYPVEKWVKFTAPDSAYYTFDVDTKNLKGIESCVTVEYKNIRDNSVPDKGEILAKAVALGSPKREIYIEAGECVLIHFTVPEDKKDDYEKAFKGDIRFSASVNVTSSGITPLEVGTVKVPAEKVSVFSFKIPEGNSLYNVAVEGGATIDNVRDHKLQQIQFVDGDGNKVTLTDKFAFTVDADGKSTLNGAKAGDKVYIQVRNEGEKEAEIKVAVKSGTQTIAVGETPLTLDDDFEEWYTFTAPKAGWYKLETETTPNDSYGTHGIIVKQYGKDQIFGNENDGSPVSSGSLMEFQAGGTVVFKVTAEGSDAADGNTTNAKITISEVPVTPINADAAEPTTVSLNGKAGDVTYYVFTPADTTTEYTLRWDFVYDRNMPELAEAVELNGSYIPVSDGEDNFCTLDGKRYIKVTQKTDNAVSGKLSITSGKTTTKSLRLGVPMEITLEKKNDTQIFNFIASRALLGYRVEVANMTEANELKDLSVVLRDDEIGDFVTINAGETEYLDWTNENGMTALTITAGAPDVKVKVTVTANTAEELDGDKTLDITSQTLKWYTYRIPADGRYTWQDENNADVTWKSVYYNDGTGTLYDVYADDYCTKGRRLYIKVEGDQESETTDQVTIKAPEKVADKLTYLTPDTPAKLVENTYYGFKADESGDYNFKFEGSYSSNIRYLEKNSSWANNSKLDKDAIVFFKAAGSGTVTVTKLPRGTQEVGTGDTDITDLENGETAKFTFIARKTGVYEVKASSENATLTLRGGTSFGPQDVNNHKAVILNAGGKLTMEVSNKAKGEETKASFKLSIAELNVTTPASEALIVPKKSVAWYRYTAPEAGAGITATITKPGKNTDAAAATPPKPVTVATIYYTYDAKTNLYQEYDITKEVAKDKEIYFAIANNEDADVTYTFTAAVTKYPENTLSFAGGETRTISYTAEKGGTYTFTAKSYDGGSFTATSDAFNGLFANGKATTVILHAGDVITIKVKQTQQSLEKDEGRHSLLYEIKPDKTVDAEVASGSLYEIKADDTAKEGDTLEDVIIEYTIEKAGDYAVEFEGGTVRMAGEGNKSLEEGLVSVNDGMMLADKAVGDRIYFVVTGMKKKAGFKLGLNRAEDFSAETITDTVTYPATKYYKLTVEDDKVYELRNIAPTGDPAPTAATVWYNTNGWNSGFSAFTTDANTVTVNLDGSGETVYLKVTGSTVKDGENYKASAYTLKRTEYTDFGTGKSGTLPANETLFYEWKAPATGTFRIEMGDEPKVGITVVRAVDRNGSDVTDLTADHDYKKGTKVYFKVEADDKTKEAAYNLTMVQFVPETSADGTFKGDAIPKDKTKTYEWTVTQSGDYVLEYTGKAGIEVYKDDSKVESIPQAADDKTTVQTRDAFGNAGLKLKKDDVITVEVSNMGSETALAYDLSIKQITYAAVEEKEFTLSPGRYAYYKYTVSNEDDKVEAACEGVSFSRVYPTNQAGGSKVQYYKVSNGADAEGKYTLSINAVKDLSEAPSGTVAKGKSISLEYTADVEGLYLLTYEGKASVEVDRELIASESSEGTKVVREYYLYQDDGLRISVSNAGSDTPLDYKLSVTRVSYEYLTANTAVEKEIDNTGIDYYRFTAAKGRYVLRFTGLDQVSIKYSTEYPDDWSWISNKVSDPQVFIPDEENDTIYLRVEKKTKDSDNTKVKYSLTAKTYDTLTVDKLAEGTFAANGDTYAYYKFTSPVTGQYIVEYGGDGYDVVGDAAEGCVRLNKGETCYFTVQKTDAADKEVKYHLVVKNYTSMAGNEAGGELETGKTAYYKYTFNEVNKDAEYVLETKGTVSWSWNPAENGWNTVTASTSIGDISPERGDTIYFKAENGTAEKMEYKLTLVTYTYKDVEPGKAETGEVAKGKYVLFRYTPVKTGDYNVVIPNEGVTATIQRQEESNWGFSNEYTEYGGSYPLTPDYTYKWIISHNPADGDNASKYSITLSEVERTPLANGEKNDITFTAENSGTQYYTYTIPGDGQYVIEKSSGLSVDIRVDGAYKLCNADSNLYLKKDQVMDLSVSGFVSETAYTLKIKKEQSVSLTDGEGKEQKLAPQEIVCFSCPVTEEGNYTVEAVEDLTYYYRVVESISDNSPWIIWNDELSGLEAGKTLYIRAYNNGAEEVTCTMKVTSPSKQKENADKDKPAEG